MSDLFKPKLAETATIAEKMLLGRPKDGRLGTTIFLIGAGCSVTARIPTAPEIARLMTVKIGPILLQQDDVSDPTGLYRGLVTRGYLTNAGGEVPLAQQVDENINWYLVYDEIFCRHYNTPDDVRGIFEEIFREAGGAINWAHLCLGELTSQRFIPTVLTTNFDQLVLSGMMLAGVLPVVCDGLESLNRVIGAPPHAQLIELHGSRHTYLLRNRPEDVKEVRSHASEAIEKLLQHAKTFVVVGYDGREEGVMELLIQAARRYRDKNLFWVQHSPDPEKLGQKARQFLATSQNGGLIVGQDADCFFLELSRKLRIGAPSAVSEPLKRFEGLIHNLDACQMKERDICSEIESAKRRCNAMYAALNTLANEVTHPISEIRERRLSGDYAEAYRLAEEALTRATEQ